MIDLPSKHLEIVNAILAEHVPEFTVWVFGSRATNSAREYSDLDLAVITEQPISVRRIDLLAAAFSESDMPIKVDIVDWASTSPGFRKVIQQNHEVLTTGEASSSEDN